MTKPKVSMTLSEKAIAAIKVVAEETGLTFSSAQELIDNYIDDNYLTASVVVYYTNGYKIEDGRYKDGVVQD